MVIEKGFMTMMTQATHCKDPVEFSGSMLDVISFALKLIALIKALLAVLKVLKPQRRKDSCRPEEPVRPARSANSEMNAFCSEAGIY